MHREGPHQQKATRGYMTLDWRYSGCEVLNGVVRQYAQTVGFWKNPKWPVLSCRIVEMDSDGEYLFQRKRWRMCTNYALFEGPRTPSSDFPPLAQRQSRVLMPNDQPVRSGRLVE